jgi:hypothetical protein
MIGDLSQSGDVAKIFVGVALRGHPLRYVATCFES